MSLEDQLKKYSSNALGVDAELQEIANELAKVVNQSQGLSPSLKNDLHRIMTRVANLRGKAMAGVK